MFNLAPKLGGPQSALQKDLVSMSPQLYTNVFDHCPIHCNIVAGSFACHTEDASSIPGGGGFAAAFCCSMSCIHTWKKTLARNPSL